MIQLLIAKYGLKVGAFLAFIAILVGAGCQWQKSIDRDKVEKWKGRYQQSLEAIAVWEKNVAGLRQAVKDQNEANDRLAEESRIREASLQATHQEALARLTRSNNETIRNARDETAALRERLAGLSVAEACHEAWVEVVNE